VTPGLPAGGATLFTALAVAAAIVVLTAPDHGPRRLSRLTSGRRLAVQHISVTAAADAACPMQMVWICGLTNCIIEKEGERPGAGGGSTPTTDGSRPLAERSVT